MENEQDKYQVPLAIFMTILVMSLTHYILELNKQSANPGQELQEQQIPSMWTDNQTQVGKMESRKHIYT